MKANVALSNKLVNIFATWNIPMLSLDNNGDVHIFMNYKAILAVSTDQF